MWWRKMNSGAQGFQVFMRTEWNAYSLFSLPSLRPPGTKPGTGMKQ